ncbi:glutathione peroxidase [Nakamurella endophytica]|uniref:Glutathione peroxidase n=1 Tax=Nakamurella endophytica TaxID=1748367 RepID=A0A917WEG4_9ACTN|nr:glutathione peroxidase [Nakamurella endophytica]GGL98009.1 glutathione peroxidase [Nakamurella endophytica]
MSVHDFTVTTAEGTDSSLADYRGRVLLLVNVASRCGLTPQYTGLEQLQEDLGERDLQVLGFPCNQFGGQEPGSDADIQTFCSTTYGVTFPVLAKIEVNGDHAHPLYGHLRTEAPRDLDADGRPLRGFDGEYPTTDDIAWNFTKFLVDRDGAVLARFGPSVTPDQLRPAVERALAG